ncbi:hypothetical protein ACJX0J_023497 [Zea mays]
MNNDEMYFQLDPQISSKPLHPAIHTLHEVAWMIQQLHFVIVTTGLNEVIMFVLTHAVKVYKPSGSCFAVISVLEAIIHIFVLNRLFFFFHFVIKSNHLPLDGVSGYRIEMKTEIIHPIQPFILDLHCVLLVHIIFFQLCNTKHEISADKHFCLRISLDARFWHWGGCFFGYGPLAFHFFTMHIYVFGFCKMREFQNFNMTYFLFIKKLKAYLCCFFYISIFANYGILTTFSFTISLPFTSGGKKSLQLSLAAILIFSHYIAMNYPKLMVAGDACRATARDCSYWTVLHI